jgi:archaellum biogenesis ATPase FlaH
MTKEITDVILHSLMTNIGYAEKVLPYLEEPFFEHSANPIFKAIQSHFGRYGSRPTYEQVAIAIRGTPGDPDDRLARLKEVVATDEAPDDQWLLDETEHFIARQRKHYFLLDTVEREWKGEPLPSPEQYANALTFSFSDSERQGHDFFEDCELLYQHMTDENERFPFDVAELNRLTNGGVSRKTLNVILAPTNVGKSLMLCHLAAMYMRQGRKVLYITLEMSDKTTAQRVTANMLDRSMNSLASMAPEEFSSTITALRDRCPGDLVIREFPALSVTTTNFRALVADLKRARKFVPDVVIVDYLNLCGAASLRKSSKADLYQTVGTIAAELRGFATEQNVVLWTATQTNRSGYKATELELEHMSESYAPSSNADLILGLRQDEKSPNARIIKLLKNRNEGISGSNKAVVGVDSGRMKLYNFDSATQVNAAIKDMSKVKQDVAAAKVYARRPKYAIEDENLAEAV